MFSSLFKHSSKMGPVKNKSPILRNHHTDPLNIKIVANKDLTMIHPISRYILEWDITDQDGMKTAFTYKLASICKTQVYHDYDTESLFIPCPFSLTTASSTSPTPSTPSIPSIPSTPSIPFSKSTQSSTSSASSTFSGRNLQTEARFFSQSSEEIKFSEQEIESLRRYRLDQPWYETPADFRPIVTVDLWLIPPSVLAMLMKRDSDLVTHKRIRVILNPLQN